MSLLTQCPNFSQRCLHVKTVCILLIVGTNVMATVLRVGSLGSDRYSELISSIVRTAVLQTWCGVTRRRCYLSQLKNKGSIQHQFWRILFLHSNKNNRVPSSLYAFQQFPLTPFAAGKMKTRSTCTRIIYPSLR